MQKVDPTNAFNPSCYKYEIDSKGMDIALDLSMIFY